MPAIDLHVHSTASDGELPPRAVARRAAAAGLDVIGLTDHDTVAGVATATEAGVELGLRVIAGCEFSVRASWGEMHLLAYFLPLDDPPLEAFLAVQREHRAARADEIVRRLNRAGVGLDVADVRRAADGEALGRPHVARALVSAGAVPDEQSAFDRYLGNGRPAFVPKHLPEVTDVTSLVASVGGVTSAAHLKMRATRGGLEQLRAAGVDGVEVRHPAHDEVTQARILRLAEELGLLVSGGTDWHGEAAAVARGADLGDVMIPSSWLAALEARHRERLPGRVSS